MGKRSGLFCSNPVCRVSTVGPNTDPASTTSIGECAHIHGARLGTARFLNEMSDLARAEITNAIWLCRNCHKKADRDEEKYPAELLFAWRDEHDRYVGENLGTSNDGIRFDLKEKQLDQFEGYPPIIRRIVLDQPDGWEWRLTGELMRHLNRPLFRKLNDLDATLYLQPLEQVVDEAAPAWLQLRISEMSKIVTPISPLISRLSESWGEPGQPGDIDEIHHICLLIRDWLEQVIQHEERLYFVSVSEAFHPVIDLLKSIVSSQAEKLSEVPDMMDEIVSLIGSDHEGTEEEPLVVRKVIDFELPDGWIRQIERELKRAYRKLDSDGASGGVLSGCLSGIMWVLISILILIFIF